MRTSTFQKIVDCVADLGWEVERMTSSGQETYDELCKLLEQKEYFT